MNILPVALLALALAGCANLGIAPQIDTTRSSEVELDLPSDEAMFVFAVFGDRTGGPDAGIKVLEQAVEDVNLVSPDLVMTVGDLVNGYNQSPQWLGQMREYKAAMNQLTAPWFPVAGNHDVYWRGPGDPPPGEHEPNYERHFGPLWYAFEHKNSWFFVLYTDEGNPDTGERTFRKPVSQQMSAEQLQWLDRTLQQASQADHVFVFLHHPRWLGGRYGDDWTKVHQVLAGAGNVSAVFAGHIHRMRYDGVRDGIEYFTLATVGGWQSHAAPEAGYLHHYQLVTVRPGNISVVAYPVGEAMDPRTITGTVSREARMLARTLRPRFGSRLALSSNGMVSDVIAVEIENPTSKPIDVTVAPTSKDSRWSIRPSHLHATIGPGDTQRFNLSVHRDPGGVDPSLRRPGIALDIDYLADEARFSIPQRTFHLPLDLTHLPPTRRPGKERVLSLDGNGNYAKVSDQQLRLPDGPFTIEAWINANGWKSRQGLLNKTEGSEFGFLIHDGVPQFLVHLNDSYRKASADGVVIGTGSWHHLAGVFDGAEIRLYLDGRLLAKSPAIGKRSTNTLPLHIGADVDAKGRGTDFFDGSIDEIRISTVARYGSRLFTPLRRFNADPDTALLLHMDGPVGDTWLFDSSRHRAHAVIHGDGFLESRQ